MVTQIAFQKKKRINDKGFLKPVVFFIRKGFVESINNTVDIHF